MASTGFSPELFLFQDPPNSKPFKELLPFLPAHGSRHGLSRSNISVSHEQNDLQKLRSGLHGYSQFVNYLAVRGIPLPAHFQDMQDDSLLSCFDMDGQWKKNRKEFLEFLMSRSSNIKEDYLGPSNRPELMEIQAIPTDMYQTDVDTIKFQLENSFGANGSFRHANGYPYNQDTDSDFVLDVPFPSMRLHLEERSSFVDNLADMKDLGSVLAEFAVLKDSAQYTKHQVVPHFTWSDAIALQDQLHSSPVMLKTVTASPLKSPKKVHKRKTKKATTERNLYRDNSFHAFETILSLMVDKNHNGKAMMNSLKKSSPALPQLLTQVSASIAGTGLAVMFSVLYKVACGSVPFSTLNLLTSGFGVGLFWLSGAVNRLRDTIIYIRKSFSKTGFEDEEMITRVDESVKAILFRTTALMAVLMLRFA